MNIPMIAPSNSVLRGGLTPEMSMVDQFACEAPVPQTQQPQQADVISRYQQGIQVDQVDSGNFERKRDFMGFLMGLNSTSKNGDWIFE